MASGNMLNADVVVRWLIGNLYDVQYSQTVKGVLTCVKAIYRVTDFINERMGSL